MLAGRLYHADDPEIQADQQSAKEWMVRYNAALGAGDAQCKEWTSGRQEGSVRAKIDRECRLIKGQVFLWKAGQTWEDLWDPNGVIPA